MARGIRKSQLFIDDVDRRKFLKILTAGLERYGCVCFAYCLMGNHFHFVIQTPRSNISRFMQFVNSVYAQYFNWRHRCTGHVYEGRFKAPVIEDSEHVRLTEFDPQRTTTPPAGVRAIDAPIDPAERDLQGHALLGPSTYQLERRTDDSHEVPAVLLTEIGFDLTAVIDRIRHSDAARSDAGPGW